MFMTAHGRQYASLLTAPRLARCRCVRGTFSVPVWSGRHGCIPTGSAPYWGMAEYKLVLDGLSTFRVVITPATGFRSVLGFPTEAAALMWIAERSASDANFEVATAAW